MSEFILEIFSEEIPALMQKAAAENFKKIALEILAKSNLDLKNAVIETYAAPNRLALFINNISAAQSIPATRKMGPKINADERAIQGFLKSVGLENISQLEKTENNGAPCYVYVKPAFEIKTAEILQNNLTAILQKMTNAWPKLMRFDIAPNQQAKWIRPVRNIACVFDSEIINIEFFGLKSNNLTFAKDGSALEITDALHYKDILRDNFVIVDHAERKQKIIQQIRKIKFDLALDLIDDEEKSPLFDEVNGLCSWPTAMLGEIDSRFMTLPEEILVLTLKLNQRYFCLKNHDGTLSRNFIFVSNAINGDENKIVKDNERLVRARLSDAEFFIAEDLKKPLIERIEGLKNIIFHQKLGSVHDKILRLNKLAKSLVVFVPHADLCLVDRAINLAKADLTCKAVAEFTELQGKVGSFYAQKQNENSKVAAAIFEHYLPLGPNSELPKTSLGILLSISDKIDNIVGFFLADEKPTSSKDPYALRRAALGVIRIAFQYNIAFPIRILIEKSINSYPNKLLKNLLGEQEKSALVEEIVKFFVERLKVSLKENLGLSPDIVNAVIDEYLSDLESHKYCDILYLAKKIKFLDEFINDEKNKNIIALYKRAANILTIEEKKDSKSYNGKPALLSLKSKYERTLYLRIKQIKGDFRKLIFAGEFEKAFKLLHVIEAPLSHFFDHVVVNDKSKKLRENRLVLLSQIRDLFDLVADLSKIEIA